MECFGSIRRNRSLSVACRSSSKGPRGYANTGGGKKLRQSAKRSRTDESVGRELVFLRVLVCENRAIGDVGGARIGKEKTARGHLMSSG